jgi:glucan phosphorylase
MGALRRTVNASSIHDPKRLANHSRNLQLTFWTNLSVVLLHSIFSGTEIWLELSHANKKNSKTIQMSLDVLLRS